MKLIYLWNCLLKPLKNYKLWVVEMLNISIAFDSSGWLSTYTVSCWNHFSVRRIIKKYACENMKWMNRMNE